MGAGTGAAGIDPGSRTQVLKALAVLTGFANLVAGGSPAVPFTAGVDIIFLLSAFLLTRTFAGRTRRQEPLDVGRYWKQRIRRLVPSTVLVLLATWGAALALRGAGALKGGFAGLGDLHPFAQLVPLAVLCQLYVLWPLLIRGSAAAARKLRLPADGALASLFASVFVASLAFALQQDATGAGLSDLAARWWEFALGSLLAVMVPKVEPGRVMKIAAVCAGLFLLPVAVLERPGSLASALCACLGAALLIIATCAPVARLRTECVRAHGLPARDLPARDVPGGLSANRLVCFLADSVLALFLWHWPLLILYLEWSGRPAAGPLATAVLAADTVLLAAGTRRVLESPRTRPARTRARRPLTLAAAGILAIVVLPVGVAQGAAHLAAPKPVADNPGAAVLQPDFRGTVRAGAPVAPLPENAKSDWANWPGGCTGGGELESTCDNGRTDNPARTVVVIGSSHALAWSTPLLELADRYNWHVISITKGFCPVTGGSDPTVPAGCVGFIDKAVASALSLKPDAVMTTSTRAGFNNTHMEWLDPSWGAQIAKISDAGIPVIALRDTPRFDQDGGRSGVDCVAQNPKDYSSCTVNEAENLAAVAPTEALAGTLPGVHFLDLTDQFCRNGSCPAVTGNVLMYTDGNHPSATYMRSLTPVFEQRLFLAMGGWG